VHDRRFQCNLSENRWLRAGTFCALYFAQGLPYGFVTIALAAMLSERGATKEQVANIVALSVLPWTFKIFWGPIIDSFHLPALGRRRPWIVFSQLMMAATLLISISTTNLASDATITLICAITFIHNCFASLQDVSTDALALDLLEEGERGRVNAFMWGSKLLGKSVGGAGIASIVAATSIDAGMRIMALALLAIMLLPLLIKERPGDRLLPWSRGESHARGAPTDATNPIKVMRELWRAFRLRTTALGLVLALVVFIGEGLSIPMNAVVFTTHIGWTAEQYAQSQGTWGVIGQLLGAIGGGLLCDRFGPRRICALGILLTTFTFAAFGLGEPLWTSAAFPHNMYFLLIHCGLAMTSVALFSIYMAISWTTAAATQFTLYMTAMNLGHAFGPTLTRLDLDDASTYLVCAAVSALPLLLLPWITARTTSREPAHGAVPIEVAPE
jgi:PAT family beta-lactamase induction signal transducer AmpG